MIRKRNLGNDIPRGGKDWIPDDYHEKSLSPIQLPSQKPKNNKALLLGAAAVAYFLLMKG